MRTHVFTKISPVFLAVALFASLATPVRADKTLMWLTDWYQGNLDSAVVTQVSIPHYGDTGTAAQGYYFGKTDLILTPTTAYAPPIRVNSAYDNTGKPDSLKLPKALVRTWYAQPGFNQGNFRGGMVNVMVSYKSYNHRFQQGPPPKVQLDVGTGTGQSGQLNQSSASTPGFLDNCISKYNSDTIWIRYPAADSVIPPGYVGNGLACTDHNPFYVKVGTIHVYNPWPGKSLYVQQGGAWYPLFPEPGRLGWQTTTLWANPNSDTTFKVRVASGKPTSTSVGVQYLDAAGYATSPTGPAFDFTATPGGERWIMPPTAAGATPSVVQAAPPVRTVLMIQRPHWGASGVRVLWKGSDARYIAGSTAYCDWYTLPLYEGAIPDSIVLQHPLADTLYGTTNLVQTPVPLSSYNGWIALKGKIATGDTTWIVSPNVQGASIVTRPGAQLTMCNTKILAFSAYDYADGLTSSSPYFYAPFAETNSGVVYPSGQNKGKITDNCPDAGGGASKGLVKTTLDARGRPVWTGKVDCDIGTALHSPGNWFDTLVIAGTRVNAFKCVPVTLTLDAADGYYKFASSAYFPLNQATSVPYGPATGTNFHFAMHAKASFEYVRGLTFKFKGDDDVWIFIDKKLALDLGGQHGEMSGDIDLDKLGLVEGKSYQFDMFYSERHQTGSNMGIQTTMNLVPTVEVVFDTAGSAGNSRDIKVKTIETTLDPSKCPEEGSTTQAKVLPGRSNIYLIYPDGHQEEVDTLKYAKVGLKVTDMFSHIAIDTTKLKDSAGFTQSGLYTILISIGTEELTANFTMVTANVDAHGTLFDRDGDGRADSAFVHGDGVTPAFQNTFLAKLRWADAAGVPDTARPVAGGFFPVPGDTAIALTFAPLPERTSCPPEGCSGGMGLVWGRATANGDTVRNRLVELLDGIAPVADTAWMVYDTTGAGKDTLYVRASEPLVKFGGPLPLRDSAWTLTGRTGAALPVAGTAVVVGNFLKLAIDPAANPIQPGDSIRLGGFSGDASGNAPGNNASRNSKWVPLYAAPVARSWMLDRDGDGAPDSVGVSSKGSLVAATSVVVNWKTAAGLDTALTVALPTGIVNGFRLPAGVLKNATGCAGCRVEVTIGGEVRRFALLDSVAPVAVSGSLVFGTGTGEPDTLRLTPSEALVAAASGVWARLAADSGSAGGVSIGSAILATKSISATGDLVLLVPSGSGLDGLAWARFETAVSDTRGNAVGAQSKWVRLAVTPSARSWMLDRDGDGAPDSVGIASKGSLAAATAATVHWKTSAGLDTSFVVAFPAGLVDGFRLPAGVLGNATSCTGCILEVTVGGQVRPFALLDSVAPVALEASLIYGFAAGDADTLKIKPSEAIVAAASGTWARLALDSGSVGGVTLSNANAAKSIAAGGELVLVVASGSGLDGMVWARLETAVSDSRGNAVGAKSKWVRLRVTPSGRAALYDADGDGYADSLRVFVRGGIAATKAVVKWKTAAGLPDSRTWDVTPSTGDFGKSVAGALRFEFGATSCTGCTVVLRDASGTDLVEWSLADSVAPIALEGRYRFGATQDTLVATFSEPVAGASATATWLEWGSLVVGGPVIQSSVSGSGTSATFLLAPANGAVAGWDSLRLAAGARAGNVRDASGKGVGATSPWAPIHYGVAPFQAWLLDPAGAGRGTALRVTLARAVPAAAVAAIDSFRLSWTAADGAGFETRAVAVSGLSWDGVSSWTGSLPVPFAASRTSCVSSCTAEGIAKGGDRGLAILQDSIPPVAIRARLRYSAPETALDTFVVDLSESWTGDDPANLVEALVRVGTHATPRDLLPVRSWTLSDSRTIRIVIGSEVSTTIRTGDSARLAGLASGSRVQDAFANHVGVESPWVPVEFGLRPPLFVVGPYRSMLSNTSSVPGVVEWTAPPATDPQIEILERLPDGTFVKIDGSGGGVAGGAPVTDPARGIGIDIRVNRPLDGVMIIYDNLGTVVANQNLASLKGLWDSKQDQERTIRIQWNATGPDHRLVGSGVYLIRVVARVSDSEGHQDIRNQIWKLGYHSKAE